MQAAQARVVLAPPRWPIQAMVAVSLLIVAFVCTGVPVTNPESPAYHVEFGAYLGIFAALLLAIASSRVIGQGDRLILRNAFVDVVIPRHAVDYIDTLNGLAVVAHTGKRYNSSAYGQSALQILFESRTVQSAGHTVEQWLAAHPSTSCEPTLIRVRLRRWWYVGLPICVASALAYQLALYALAPVIRPSFVTLLELL